MELKLKLSLEDYLENQLYKASLSKAIKKRRNISRWAVLIIYLGLGLYLALKEERPTTALLFALFGLAWFVFYPLYSKHRYLRHYRKHVKENYSERVDSVIIFKIAKDHLLIKDDKSQTKISNSEIGSLVLLKKHFLIQFKSNTSLIIPRTQIEDEASFRAIFEEMKIPFENREDWKWK